MLTDCWDGRYRSKNERDHFEDGEICWREANRTNGNLPSPASIETVLYHWLGLRKEGDDTVLYHWLVLRKEGDDTYKICVRREREQRGGPRSDGYATSGRTRDKMT